MVSLSPYSEDGSDKLRAVFSQSYSRFDRLRQFDAARIELNKCRVEQDDVVKRLAVGNIHRITEASLRALQSRLEQAVIQHDALRGILLDAPADLDMNLPEDRITAMHVALERLTAPPVADPNEEHRLSGLQYGVGGQK